MWRSGRPWYRQIVTATASSSTPRRGLVGRFVYDRDGRLHTVRLLGGVVAAIALISFATFAGLLMAGAGSPASLAVWVLAGFILVKVPLLAVLWWILLRRDPEQRSADWSTDEATEILDYLEAQAAEAAGRPDAAARLAYFAKEAWFVADNAADRDKASAVAVAVRIQAMASEVTARPGSPR
ncbi:MAG: hypothetical protein QOD86_1482 [Miltoncostaeaceae bacterium]|jgi:hypothetical protein|nr:hypothetical protein [Miltoncostaeaceae bacterium]